MAKETVAKTDNNLKAAFAGESQANRRYLAFAKKADKEGHKQVAKLFRAAANAETVHALNHLEVMGVGGTADNLKVAIAGENYEFVTMYPGFIKDADRDGNEGATNTFSLANHVEKIHYGLFQKALEAVNANTEPPTKDYFVCQHCGNTVEGSAPDRCPICGAPKTKFLKID